MTDHQSAGAVAAPNVARTCAASSDVRPITQIDFARAGIVTPQMAAVAAAEGREPEAIRAAVAAGHIAIPANIHHASLAPAGVGSTLEGVPLSTKVNVNLGISGDLADEALEWEKVTWLWNWAPMPSWISPTPARHVPSAVRSSRNRRP